MIFLNEIEELALIEQIKDNMFTQLLNQRENNAELNIIRKPLSIFLISRDDLYEKYLDKNIIDNVLMKCAVLDVLKSLKYKKVNPTSFLIGRDEKGKPFINNVDIENLPNIYLSNSHKDHLHLAAASMNKIGVDLEKKISMSEALIKKIFTRDEIQNSLKIIKCLIKDKTKIDQDLAYTTMFCIKEAVSKALGMGLGMDFRKIKIFVNNSIIQAKFNELNLVFDVISFFRYEYIYILVENNK